MEVSSKITDFPLQMDTLGYDDIVMLHVSSLPFVVAHADQTAAVVSPFLQGRDRPGVLTRPKITAGSVVALAWIGLHQHRTVINTWSLYPSHVYTGVGGAVVHIDLCRSTS